MEDIAKRNKTWDELSDTDKIDRMRNVVKTMQHTIGFLQQSVEKLNQHQHSPTGGMVIPYQPYGNNNGIGGFAGSSALNNEEYF